MLPSLSNNNLPGDWSILIAGLCLVVMAVILILVLTIPARRSVRELYDRASSPIGTAEQRDYWRSCYERRDNYLFGGSTICSKLYVGTDVVDPMTSKKQQKAPMLRPIAGPSRQSPSNPAPSTGGFWPVFAPKVRWDGVDDLLVDLEAGRIRPLRPDFMDEINRSAARHHATTLKVSAKGKEPATEEPVQRPEPRVPQRSNRVARRPSFGSSSLSTANERREEEGYEMQNLPNARIETAEHVTGDANRSSTAALLDAKQSLGQLLLSARQSTLRSSRRRAEEDRKPLLQARLTPIHEDDG